MHKRGIIRYANYTVCASVFIHFCMQRKNNENIPIIAWTCIKMLVNSVEKTKKKSAHMNIVMNIF